MNEKMSTSRCVKWSKESLDFFESASDNSVVLDIVISHACASQTGEGFEELVNSINEENIKKKVKKVNILDTSYLYRHVIPDFAKYSSADVPTIWFLNNRHSIEKLAVEVELRSWADFINTDEFRRWSERLKIDFINNKGGDGMLGFRDLVFSEAAVAAYKGSNNLENCIEFMLEECAYVCTNFKNTTNLVYPMGLARPMVNTSERYNIYFVHLCYKTSKQAQRECKQISQYLDSERIDKEVALFMKESVSNVNFFVINRHGKHIYKNYALDGVIGDANAKKLPQKTWETSCMVMKTKRQVVVEEEYNGICYLSVKSPLIIDDKVEGVIGLAVDITDRKKAQQLELETKLQQTRIEEQEKFKNIAEQVSHDIRSPLAVLDMLQKICKNLSEKEHIALRNVVTSIESITHRILNDYDEENDKEYDVKAYILFPFSISEILDNKKYQYRDSKNIRFNYSYTLSSNFVFIRGDYSNFCRMMSNLMNNSIEAFEGKDGVVEIKVVEEEQLVKIYIKDNGKGMPKEMADKLTNNIPVGSTKTGGYGIGTQQIISTLQEMKCKMFVESTENIGTEITLSFPKSDYPDWFTDKIVLHKGDTVVVLDDDSSIHSIWEKRFEGYLNDISVKCFAQGGEAVDFINSSKEKEKIFLLTDYELRGQKTNGIDVIEKCKIQRRSILVTSVYVSKIKDFSEKFKVTKLLPKPYINNISIVVEKSHRNADIVFIGNNKSFAQTLSDFLDSKGLNVHTYNSPGVFLKNLSQYSTNTRIVIDNELNSEINGVELAKLLHGREYTNLYLLSGRQFREGEAPSYLTVIFKESEDFMEKLL